MAAQTIYVNVYGNGFDTMWVPIDGVYSVKDAKAIAAARYPGAKIGGTQTNMNAPCAPQRDQSDWGTVKPVQPTVPAGTFERMQQNNNAIARSNKDSSSGGGCAVILFGGLFVLGAIGNFIGGGSTQESPAPAPAPAEVVRVAPAAPTLPAAPVSDLNPCSIWAAANPTLADRLQPGDKCFGF